MRRHRSPSRRLATTLLTALAALALVLTGGAPIASEWSEPAPAEAPAATTADTTAVTRRRRRRAVLAGRRRHPVRTMPCPPQRTEDPPGTHRHARPPHRGPPARSAVR